MTKAHINLSPVEPDWNGMPDNLRRRGTPDRVFYFEHGLTSGVINAVCDLAGIAVGEGRLDTPCGPVIVRWEAGGVLQYDVPEGVSLEIRAGDEVIMVQGPCRFATLSLETGCRQA